MSKKSIVKILAIIPLFGLLTFGYYVLDALFPGENFYIREWNRNTDLPFPKSASFQWKLATYPDIHGDYTSTAIIEVSKRDFKNLYNNAISNSSVKPVSKYSGIKGMLVHYKPYNYSNDSFKDFFYILHVPIFKIGFGKDEKTIIFQRHST